jgi:hypothetical protein
MGVTPAVFPDSGAATFRLDAAHQTPFRSSP